MECWNVSLQKAVTTKLVGRAMPAGASRLLDPIHGRGVFQCSDFISSLIGSMPRMLPAVSKSWR